MAARALRSGEAEPDRRRRRREHEPRALRRRQGDQRLRPQGRDVRHHDRLALRQQADEGAVRRRLDARDRRERRRASSASAARIRTPSQCESQRRAAAAQANGRLAAEIAPVEIPQRKGDPVVVDRDEHPRETSVEALAKLKPIVREGGTVTAGNASGVNDGAAALIIATEEAAKRNGLTPRARILGAAVAGVPPRIMGIGPAPGLAESCSQRLGLTRRADGRDRAQRSLRRPGPRRAAPARRRRTTPRTSTRTAAPSRSAIRSACPAPASR